MAWCSPPAGLKACSARPERTASAAASVEPATRAEASCLSGKIGLSPGPKPNRLDVVRRVDQEQLAVRCFTAGGLRGADAVDQAVVADQPAGQDDARGPERVLGAQVVARALVTDPDQLDAL